MAATSRAVFIVAAKRTPFGTFGGKLKGFTATDMGHVAAMAALEAGKVPKEAVDSVIFGNVAQVNSCKNLLVRVVTFAISTVHDFYARGGVVSCGQHTVLGAREVPLPG